MLAWITVLWLCLMAIRIRATATTPCTCCANTRRGHDTTKSDACGERRLSPEQVEKAETTEIALTTHHERLRLQRGTCLVLVPIGTAPVSDDGQIPDQAAEQAQLPSLLNAQLTLPS